MKIVFLKWKRKKYLILGAVIILIFFYVINFTSLKHSQTDFSYLRLPNDNLPELTQTNLEELPDSGLDKIPRIIHQTWKTADIPDLYIDWIKSWHTLNPDWEYWFWTDENTRAFIAQKYPWFLDVFDNYPEPIRRADSMRYFILYEFGGVYVDLDMENLKSLSPLIKKYYCFLGQEPYVHPMIDSNFEHLPINAIMGCRKGHPFMKLLMDQLPKFSNMWHVLDSTGPHFMRLWFKDYKKYNYNAEHENGTFLTPPEWFFPFVDPVKIKDFHAKCSKYDSLLHHQKRACQFIKEYNGVPSNLKHAFTNHHWIHTYFISRYSLQPPRNIHSIVPSVKIWKP
ncbi:hypothetical protein LOTGIDRAFT_165932 [Lottia gigantea]|uniref:Uncharacterized protein n=1 Tax=Lottia gigantea TaxID=225164 RepID=V4BHJ1_LOTGI|nr:hypothetical protein LOTGIDRAFT_165932 [Lottia gigantea]ESO88189.1 hypothetical protein LOTGIDRAFT_165932 [Lottia gigantea]